MVRQNRTKVFCFHLKTLCKWRFLCGCWHYLALVAEWRTAVRLKCCQCESFQPFKHVFLLLKQPIMLHFWQLQTRPRAPDLRKTPRTSFCVREINHSPEVTLPVIWRELASPPQPSNQARERGQKPAARPIWKETLHETAGETPLWRLWWPQATKKYKCLLPPLRHQGGLVVALQRAC